MIMETVRFAAACGQQQKRTLSKKRTSIREKIVEGFFLTYEIH